VVGGQNGAHDDRAGQAGQRVDDEQPAQVPPPQARRDQARSHTRRGEGGVEQAVGAYALGGADRVGDHRLARRLVELEDESEQHREDSSRRQGVRRGDPELGCGAAGQAEHDGAAPP